MVRELGDDRPRLLDIPRIDLCELIGAAGHLRQQIELNLDTGKLGDQIVKLGENEWRKYERRFGPLKHLSAGVVPSLVDEEGRE